MPRELEARCDLLRSLHVPGEPLVLPNVWDAASARAVVAAGFPVVATTSGGVAAALGYEDHEGAPGDEMLAAAARIAGSVDVPVTVDAEAGYGLEPAAPRRRARGDGGVAPAPARVAASRCGLWCGTAAATCASGPCLTRGSRSRPARALGARASRRRRSDRERRHEPAGGTHGGGARR